MFCPKCMAEYKDGVRKCAECGVALVDAIPQKPKKPDLEYVSILETFNWGDVAMIESVLEGSGIDYIIQGEAALTVVQYVEPVTVLVVKEQVDEAKALLKDLNLSFKAFSSDGREAGACDDETSEVNDGEDET